MDVLSGREIILEFRGGAGGTQICAVDCASGVEVFVITPANAARTDQETLALRKLAKALLDQGIVKPPSMSQENSGPQFGKPLPSKRGIIV
jgi:hypothetical protein